MESNSLLDQKIGSKTTSELGDRGGPQADLPLRGMGGWTTLLE
jgi:hypothetical protein